MKLHRPTVQAILDYVSDTFSYFELSTKWDGFQEYGLSKDSTDFLIAAINGDYQRFEKELLKRYGISKDRFRLALAMRSHRWNRCMALTRLGTHCKNSSPFVPEGYGFPFPKDINDILCRNHQETPDIELVDGLNW